MRKIRILKVLVIQEFRILILRFLSTPIVLRILGDIPRDLLDAKRGFSFNFNENGELELISRISKVSNERSIVFDVGANVGDYSQALLDLNYQGQIHLFEIDSYLSNLLATKFQKQPKLIVNNFGLSNFEEQRQFRIFIKHRGANSLLNVDHKHLETIESTALLVTGDSYCKLNSVKRILLLKLDIEGWERFALQGLNQILIENRVDVVSWEYGYVTADSGWTTRNFYDYFESLGYVCGVLRKNGVDFGSWNYGLNDWKSGPNFIACLPPFVDILK